MLFNKESIFIHGNLEKLCKLFVLVRHYGRSQGQEIGLDHNDLLKEVINYFDFQSVFAFCYLWFLVE